jgi:membrane protein
MVPEMKRRAVTAKLQSEARRYIPQSVGLIWDDVMRDDCLDLAAQMSFFFILSLFPFLIVIGSVVGWLPSTGLWNEMARWLTHYLPAESRRRVFDAIVDLAQYHTQFFSFGLATTLWIASSGFVSLMESLSRAYGFRETRGFWKKRILAIGTTIVGVAFTIASFVLLTFGHLLVKFLDPRLRAVVPFPIPWELARWVVTLLLILFGLDLIGYFLPNVKRPWRWLTVGNLFITVSMAALTEGFGFYLHHFGDFPRYYGTMTAFAILMTWIYVASVILLVGAEIDSALEKLQRRQDAA